MMTEHWWGLSMQWPDKIDQTTGTYTDARGWWWRLGKRGPGVHYRNISKGGYQPLFSERYGCDRQVAIRVGPHVFTGLRPL